MEWSFIIIFLLLSGLFSGLEIAFISANKLKVELRKKKSGARGQLLAAYFEKPAVFIGSMLVGNNIALVALTYFATQLMSPFLATLFQGSFTLMLVNTIIITMVVLIFGEFLPKALFRLYADDILFAMAYPLRVIMWILSPLAWLFNKLSMYLIRLVIRTEPTAQDPAFTRLDLERFIMETGTAAEGEIVDREIFGNALNLNEVKVRDCMVPRPEIEYIDVESSVEELEVLFKETRLSRILVIHKFIADRVNIACVVDEFGAVAGVVTLEDILEEIFGEIEDEHDKQEEEHIEQQINDTEYRFSGRLEIDYLNEKYPALQLPEGDYHTLSGYLVMTAGYIPVQGTVLELDGTTFELEAVSQTKIEVVKISK